MSHDIEATVLHISQDCRKYQLHLSKSYIYIYLVLFSPVKPELGVIPSGQENHSGAEHLNIPGREL